jgi:phytanoyl-CoA hydroxylase
MVETEVSTSASQQLSLPKADICGRYYPTDRKNLNLESNFGSMVPEQIGYL